MGADQPCSLKNERAFSTLPPKRVSSYQRRGHHFGAREASLGIVAVDDGLQEIAAQAVDGGYGIVHCILPI
jgi:hypothetical protein